MAALNYAASYQQALAQKYAKGMYFGALFTTPNNKLYKVDSANAKEIKIPVLSVKGRTDADRDTIGTFERSYDNSWETKTLTNLRKWSTLVHPLDIYQTNMVASISNITSVMNAEEKLPEKQKYLVSKIYSLMEGESSNVTALELTSDNILDKIDDIAIAMDEAGVPVEGRMLYVTPAVNKLIKNSLTRRLNATDTVLVRGLDRLDEFTIVSVPSDLMKSVYNFTTGATPGGGAKQIQILAIHPLSILTPEVYSFVGFDEPSAKTGGKYLYYEESAEDVFILEQRKAGIHIVTANA